MRRQSERSARLPVRCLEIIQTAQNRMLATAKRFKATPTRGTQIRPGQHSLGAATGDVCSRAAAQSTPGNTNQGTK
jgi:hypothetical protein